MGLHQASDRMGQRSDPCPHILRRGTPLSGRLEGIALVADPAYPWVAVGLEEEAVAGRVEGRAPGQPVCRCLGRRAYPLARRTPVLYSRNQSRTNIALS